MTSVAPTAEQCFDCATQLAPTMLACPACGRLVHSERLTQLAQSAEEATVCGDLSSALACWREGLDLLPTNTRQYQVVEAKITDLGQRLPAGALPPGTLPAETLSARTVPHGTLSEGPLCTGILPTAPRAANRRSANNQSPAAKVAAGVGALGMLAWKAKALLLGLTKGTTLLTMLLSLGVYWSMWGWPFALGLVLSIYVHEMGHVIALARYGFRATAPMFIPGLGALVRLKQRVVNPLEDAEIGLAGPIYGLGAAIFSLGLWFATGREIFAAIAGVGASINLFNLLPIAFLDGGRGFHAMSRLQKFLAAGTAGGAYWLTGDGMLLLVALVGACRAFGTKPTDAGSWKAAITYILLIVFLTAIVIICMTHGQRTK